MSKTTSFFGIVVTEVWPVFSTVVTVISLASLSEPLVAWANFTIDLIEIYRNFTYPIYDFFLGWIPIKIPNFVKDYQLFGIIVGASFLRGVFSHRKVVISLNFKVIIFSLFCLLLLGFMSSILWPIIIAYGFWGRKNSQRLISIVSSEISVKKSNLSEKLEKRDFSITPEQWVNSFLFMIESFRRPFLISLIAFVLLLVVNYAFFISVNFPPLF